MRLEAYNNNGKKVISRKIDEDLIHLLTKRYNPNKSYSGHSQKTFKKLIELAGIPTYNTKSGKIKKTGGCNRSGIKYYKTRINYTIG